MPKLKPGDEIAIRVKVGDRMDAEREKVIREHWLEFGSRWPTGHPVFKVPVRKPWTAAYLDQPPSGVMPTMDDLTFTVERGTFDGKPADRVMCEGIVVEQRASCNSLPCPGSKSAMR